MEVTFPVLSPEIAEHVVTDRFPSHGDLILIVRERENVSYVIADYDSSSHGHEIILKNVKVLHEVIHHSSGEDLFHFDFAHVRPYFWRLISTDKIYVGEQAIKEMLSQEPEYKLYAEKLEELVQAEGSSPSF